MARNHRRIAAMAFGIAMLGGIAACGNDGDDGTTGSASDGATGEESMSITIGLSPWATLSPVHLAIQDGLFEEAGLEVTLHESPGGAASLAALVAGEVDVAYAPHMSFIQSIEQGMPISIFRGNDVGTQGDEDGSGVFTMPDSGITDVADLEGASIAINAFGGIQELTARAVLDAEGLAPDEYELVEIAPPSMLQSMETGAVDAAWLGEPYLTIGVQDFDVQLVADMWAGALRGMPNSGWATSDSFAETSPAALAAFDTVMGQVLSEQAASEDQTEIRDVIGTYTEIDPEILANMTRVQFDGNNDLERLIQVQELMVQYGMLSEVMPIEDLVIDPHRNS